MRIVHAQRDRRRWSKLQKALYNLVVPSLHFQIHCTKYRMQSQRGSTDIPRYWVTVGKGIVFDYPKQFVSSLEYYPYCADVSSISDIIREYIDTPVDTLLTKVFENDKWGLVDILRAADRRFSLKRLSGSVKTAVVLQILKKRDKGLAEKEGLQC